MVNGQWAKQLVGGYYGYFTLNFCLTDGINTDNDWPGNSTITALLASHTCAVKQLAAIIGMGEFADEQMGDMQMRGCENERMCMCADSWAKI